MRATIFVSLSVLAFACAPARAAGACNGVKTALSAPHGHADWLKACMKATPGVPDARRLCEMRFARCRRGG